MSKTKIRSKLYTSDPGFYAKTDKNVAILVD
jgi:hypothetical protein